MPCGPVCRDGDGAIRRRVRIPGRLGTGCRSHAWWPSTGRGLPPLPELSGLRWLEHDSYSGSAPGSSAGLRERSTLRRARDLRRSVRFERACTPSGSGSLNCPLGSPLRRCRGSQLPPEATRLAHGRQCRQQQCYKGDAEGCARRKRERERMEEILRRREGKHHGPFDEVGGPRCVHRWHAVEGVGTALPFSLL